MHPALASIQVSVEGRVAQALYDPQLAESFILLSFCSLNHLFNRLGVCNSTVAAEIHTGEYFTCSMKLKVLDRICHPYSIILGRDWFNMCSTGLEDKPEAAGAVVFVDAMACFCFITFQCSSNTVTFERYLREE